MSRHTVLQQSMRSNRSIFRSPTRRARAAFGLGTLATAVGVAACSDKSSTSPSSSISATATTYIDSALSFENQVDYWYQNVNFPAQRADVFKVAGAAQVDSQTWSAIDTSIVPWLQNADPAPGGDQHSAFFPATEAPGVVNSPGSALYLTSGSNFPLSGSANNVGYVWLPTYDGTNDTGRADSIQTVIRTLDQSSPCGWIIDLRYNPGGTWAAMLDGINPILGNAPYGGGQQGFLSIVDRDGVKSYFFLQNGVAGITTPGQNGGYDTVYTRASSNYTLKRPGSPVAILQGGYTASAGEEIVLAFRGVSFPVRTFGASTYGVTTAPYGAYMTDLAPGVGDSSYINIVGAIDVDRTGMMWGGSIPPTVAVAGPSGATVEPATSSSSDPVVQAATQWLQTQSACGGSVVASKSAVPGPVFSASPVSAAVRTMATTATPRYRVARYHVAEAPRARLRARVLGGRVQRAGGR